MANTAGEKELKNSWDELTASDETKAIGHEQTLVAETDLILKRNREGL